MTTTSNTVRGEVQLGFTERKFQQELETVFDKVTDRALYGRLLALHSGLSDQAKLGLSMSIRHVAATANWDQVEADDQLDTLGMVLFNTLLGAVNGTCKNAFIAPDDKLEMIEDIISHVEPQ